MIIPMIPSSTIHHVVFGSPNAANPEKSAAMDTNRRSIAITYAPTFSAANGNTKQKMPSTSRTIPLRSSVFQASGSRVCSRITMLFI